MCRMGRRFVSFGMSSLTIGPPGSSPDVRVLTALRPTREQATCHDLVAQVGMNLGKNTVDESRYDLSVSLIQSFFFSSRELTEMHPLSPNPHHKQANHRLRISVCRKRRGQCNNGNKGSSRDGVHNKEDLSQRVFCQMEAKHASFYIRMKPEL